MTRAVDQVPFGGRRSSRHDEICAAIVRSRGRVFVGSQAEVMARVEYPCGRGFCDAFIWTDAPPGEVESAIVEVKTNDECWTAGDAIRQLRWYQQNIRPPFGVRRAEIGLVLVVENGLSLVAEPVLTLCGNEGIEVVPACYFENPDEGQALHPFEGSRLMGAAE